MQQYSKPTWGYKITTDTTIDVYHTLLPKISLKTICDTVTHAKEICKKTDGSISIITDSPIYVDGAIEEVSKLFEEIEYHYIDTPKFYYHIDEEVKVLLKEWMIAFVGCLGILISHEKKLQKHFIDDWQYINSPVGGLYFQPYTLFFYENYAKVIHPVIVQNYDIRQILEQKTALYVNQIAKRMQEAQRGFEGLAMLSAVEEKTHLKPKEIAKIINDKSYRLKAPKHSPIFR